MHAGPGGYGKDELGGPWGGLGSRGDAWGCSDLHLPLTDSVGWVGGVAPCFRKRSPDVKGTGGAFDICFCSVRVGRNCGIKQLALNRWKK